MSRNPSHKWLLKFTKSAKRKLDALTSANRRVVFRNLRELLIADNPFSSSSVEMLEGKKFERTRKFRAGDFRVFFVIKPVQIVDQKHMYKGTLYVLDIRDRKEAY